MHAEKQLSALRKRTRMQAEKLLLSTVECRHANTRGDSLETRSATTGIAAATLLSSSQCETQATRCALTARSTGAHAKGACWHPSMKRQDPFQVQPPMSQYGTRRVLRRAYHNTHSSVRAVAFPFLSSSAQSLAFCLVWGQVACPCAQAEEHRQHADPGGLL